MQNIQLANPSAKAIWSEPFRRAVASASIISIADDKGTIQFVNDKFVAISGYSEAELLGQNHSIINSNYHPKRFWQQMWKTIASGNPWRAEVRNRNKNGTYYWVDTFIMPFEDGHGRVTEYLSIRNDITARKHYEQMLANANAQLRATLLLGKIGSGVLNVSTKSIYVSAELMQLLNADAPEPTSMSFDEFIQKYLGPRHRQDWNSKFSSLSEIRGNHEIMNAIGQLDGELLMQTASGSSFWAEARMMVHDDDIIIAFQDITDRKVVREDLSKKRSTIDTLLKGIHDGFFALDKNFHFSIVSPVFAKLAQMNVDDMLGRSITDVFPFMVGNELLAQYQKAFSSQQEISLEHCVPSQPEIIYQIHACPSSEGLFVYYKDISLSKKAERSLLEKSALFQRLSENVPGMIYNCLLSEKDELLFPFVSSGAKLLLGISDIDLINNGSVLFHIIHPDDLLKVLKSIRDAFNQSAAWNCEFRIKTESGADKWIASDSNPYREADGNLLWYGFMHDITERKLSEQRLIESETKNRLIIENSGEGILFTNPDGRIFSANPEACRIFGMTEAEICAGGRSALVDANDPRAIKALRHRQEKGNYNGELTMKRKDGSTFDAEVVTKLFVSPDGQTNASVLLRDISNRKRNEEELMRLALIASKTANVVIATDVNGYTIWVNDAFERITGYTREEILGKSPGSLLQGKNTDPSTIETMRACLSQRKGFKVEVLNYSKTGDEIWLDIEVMPVHDSKKTFTGYIAIQSDITEKKHAIRHLETAQRQVQDLYNELNAILNASTDASFFLDKDLKIRVFNQTAEQAIKKIYGKQVSQGDSMLMYSTQETVSDFQQNFAKALAGTPVIIEREILYPNNLKTWTQVRYLPVHDKSGEVIGISFNATDITQRKISDQKLFQSKQYFESLVNSQSSLLVRIDLDGHFTFVNDQFCKHFLLSKEEVIGVHALDFLEIEDLHSFQKKLEACISQPGKVHAIVLEMKSQKRKSCFISWEAVALTNEFGIVSEIQGVGLDTTHQVMNQRKLQTLNDRMRMATRLANLGVWDFDFDSGSLTWDDMLYEVIGFPSNVPITVEAFDKQIWAEDLAEMRKVVSAITPTRNSASGKLRINRPNDGRLIYIKYFCQGEFDSAGLMKRLVGVNYDITEQELSNQVIRESEERFRLIADTAPVFIWMTDSDNHTTFLNKHWYNFTGGSPESQLGKGWLTGIHPDDRAASGAACVECFDERRNLYMEYRLRRHDGTYRWLVDTGVPRYLETGEFIGYVGSCFDITERKDSEARLAEDIERRKHSEQMLTSALAEKDLLIKEIHHRIKNNLQLISSILYIKMAGISDTDTKDFLTNVRHKIRSVALIHERLLQSESVNKVDLQQYLKDLVGDIRSMNSSNRVPLEYECDIERHEVNIDTAIYCGLIVNEAITNSIKHAFAGRAQGKITLCAKADKTKLILSIGDDGVSMPAEKIPGVAGSFGMQLISIFAKQLNASLETFRQNGTRYEVTFDL